MSIFAYFAVYLLWVYLRRQRHGAVRRMNSSRWTRELWDLLGIAMVIPLLLAFGVGHQGFWTRATTTAT